MPTSPLHPVLCLAAGTLISLIAGPASAQEPAAPRGPAPCVNQPGPCASAGQHVCPRCGRVHADGEHGGRRSWHDVFFSPYGRPCRFIVLDPPYQPPPGSAVNPFWYTQIANGEAARMVLYHFDFFPGEAQLNDRGRRQLAKFQGLLAANPFPLIVERTPGGEELDELRRQHVFELLAGGPVPIPLERIRVQQPPTRGLDGADAEVIYPGLLGLTAGSGGALGGGGAGSGVSSSGGAGVSGGRGN